MTDVVIVAAGRTAVGKFGGTLAKIPASDLGAHVIKGLLARTGLKPEQISEVILGQVLTALRDGKISAGHARALITASDPKAIGTPARKATRRDSTLSPTNVCRDRSTSSP